MKSRIQTLAAILFILIGSAAASHAASDPQKKIKSAVDAEIGPLMTTYGVPGMAVGVIVAGKQYVYTYGIASRTTRAPVTGETLFEIGSISKTFTATLASYAQGLGDLSFSDDVSKYFPALRGTPFGRVSLLNLGTHTPGGLPLQVPETIKNNQQLLQYFKSWKPAYPPGTYRTYSNVGIGTLGWITALSMRQNFISLMEQRLFPGIGMKNTYIEVPKSKMAHYAQGYTGRDTPIRVAPGVLASEAYGVKTTAPDMVRYMEVNMNLVSLDTRLQQAIVATHTGYFQAGPMTQDLIWEQYPYPVTLQSLLQGNSAAMALHANAVKKINPPENPREDVWINKTGSTNGFGSYVAFVPGKRLGIVILANKNYPTEARVTAAYKILTAISVGPAESR